MYDLYHMKSICLLLVCYIYSIYLSASGVSGLICDAKTGNPVEYATVYIDGTTFGTTSDTAGKFKLIVEFENFQLVVRHLSYESQAIQFKGQSSKNVRIDLIPRDFNIREVTIGGKSKRAQNLAYFKKVFLGTDDWGRKAEILNDSVLFFNVQYSETDSRSMNLSDHYQYFAVYAVAPLKIYLPKQGYILEYDLLKFEEAMDTEFGMKVLSSLGFMYFKEIADVSAWKVRKFRRNRYKAYYHSEMHFIRSFYGNKLPGNGYEVFMIEKKAGNILDYIPFSPDSCQCVYYQGEDALVTGMNDKKLMVNYYTNAYKPINLKKKFGNSAGGIEILRFPNAVSRVYFKSDSCLIRKNGTLPGGKEIIFSNDITEKRYGAALPSNFEP